MNTTKLSVTELHDFVQSEEGWELFVPLLNGMASMHEQILLVPHDDPELGDPEDIYERKVSLVSFEAGAALVDFVNALLARRSTDAR